MKKLLYNKNTFYKYTRKIIMSYELCFNKHESLLKKIQNGEVTLFTGAGFSLGGTVKGKNIFINK